MSAWRSGRGSSWPTRIGEIVHGKRRITPSTALKLSRVLGLSDRYWINIQADFDIEIEQELHRDELEQITPLTARPRSSACHPALHMVVYCGVMSRTNIEIDDDLIERAMSAFGLRTKREAVHLALERLLGGGPMSVEDQLDMEGVGWDGDLDALRADRFADGDHRAAG